MSEGTYIVTNQSTRQISRTDLVGVSSIAFMRAIDISVTVTNARPSTRLYAFFDGRSIAQFVTPQGGVKGGPIITNAQGEARFVFHCPPATFNTGIRNLKVQDTPSFQLTGTIPGSTTSGADADFETEGIKRTFQETLTTINTTTITTNILNTRPPPPGDPLAQSFFTFGVTGGCFITKIDIWFQSKDNAVPVTLDIRELQTGLPARTLVNRYAKATLNPSQVNVSNNASVPTSFVFDTPVYLEQDKDYCFVLAANSNSYQVWTSKLGEVSRETGQTIFEQPFIGSLFKSENNVTWTAEQTEDIKFRIWKARFDTNVVGNLNYSVNSSDILVLGDQFSVESGSTNVTVTFNHQHQLEVGSVLKLGSFPGKTYRGIPAASLDGEFTVTSVLSPYTLTFSALSPATSTGTLASTNTVMSIEVDNGGFGYTSAPTIVISGGGGVGATATAVLTGGVITSINVTNPGTGYISAPSVTVLGGGGSGAQLTAIVEAIFVVGTNRLAHIFTPIIPAGVLPDTELTATLRPTSTGYQIGQESNIRLNSNNVIPGNNWIVSPENQEERMFGQTATDINIRMTSTNRNTSPFVAVREQQVLETVSYVINNQDGETIEAQDSTGTIQSILVTNPGSGYSTAPTVVITGSGSGATATATVAGGVVTGITVNTPGSGFREVPFVQLIGGGGSGAAAQAQMSEFNTELLPSGGSALSKYISKPVTLASVSKGARVFVSAYSRRECSFEVYFRSSLSGSGQTHRELEWKLMSCPVERNLSVRENEYLDYEFSIDNLPPFDVYDIKIVLRTQDPSIVPVLDNYRVIILAT